jgi:hypothetical protein
MTRSFILLTFVALAAVVAAGASSAASRTAADRQHVSVDFTLPDICTFPINVHTEGWMIETSGGTVYRSTATLASEDFSRSLTQANHSVVRDSPGGGGYTDVYLERIVLPGTGIVYGTMGKVTFFFDGDGNYTGSEFHGRSDPYSQYAAVVCGYLAR